MASLSLFTPESLEDNIISKDSQELLGLTIKSNCNNELNYIPIPPACNKEKEDCKPIECNPLGLNEINNIQEPKLLGRGGMNAVIDITYDKDLPLALRLTTTDTDDIKEKESVGLLYQTKLSKSIEEGGYGCPYIAKVYDFGDYTGNFNKNVEIEIEIENEIKKKKLKIPEKGVYGILEKLPMDLFERATTEGNIFTENDLKSMTKQLLMALSCMHKNNIYHFDIKPENIMMCDDGNENVKLIDFGLCYTYDKDTYDENDPTNEVLTLRGTPDYFSPGVLFRADREMENIPCPIDDLWALAVTICLISFPTSLKRFTGKGINKGTKMYIFNKDYEKKKKLSKMPESIRFCKRIFDTVTILSEDPINGGEMQPTDETFFTLTAADLLKDPWFQEVKEVKGGKSKRKRKIKNKRKTKKRKSKRKRKN